ncbi:GvpL/GvpF family gas vesicle protein [Priestia filamentosa]|uniref:GvpL/GvpF family gas vesicle protein n=1 Tax=Priestia filamentosa TaxID=1402861 RepID=UPI001FB31D60|nr:GvpL/GvpF family gas vesicle protein [Priestia filamentosa]MED3726724.1 GvpL/GvpF family gas vesicle protein [Priestia filamentosa]UOE60091.1 GvpL/GvpF family gas vesicle protein [Priestia filamentosa]
MSEELGKYPFCIIKKDSVDDLGRAVLDGEERQLLAIPYKEFAMVVAEAPIKIYHPKKENVMNHQNTISAVMEQTDVIPMSFGNVFQSEEDIELLLQNLYENLQELFPQIEGRFEVGLKVIAKKEWLQEEMNNQSKAQKLKKKIENKSKEASYYDRIELGDFARTFMKSKGEEAAQAIFLPLAEIAASAKQTQTLGEKMLLNTSFLVDARKEEEFDAKVNELYEQWEDKVEFKYTGPWPAYNFIDIKLEARKVQ